MVLVLAAFPAIPCNAVSAVNIDLFTKGNARAQCPVPELPCTLHWLNPFQVLSSVDKILDSAVGRNHMLVTWPKRIWTVHCFIDINLLI